MPLEVLIREYVEVSLPAQGEYVRLLKTLGKSHQEEIAMRTAARATVLGIELDDKNPVVLAEGTLCAMSVVIREWSFKEPITVESVRRLDEESRITILDRMVELYPQPRTKEMERDLSEPGVPSSPPAESPQADSAGS